MNQNKISVIIINYNTAQLTLNCVESILKFEKKSNLEIIVVDNASNKDDYHNLVRLLTGFEYVQIIRSKINLGFGGGNMLGVQYATGDFYCFLNSDTLLVESIFEELITFANTKKDFGACGIQILDADEKESISFRYFEGIRYKILGKKFVASKQDQINLNERKSFKVDFVLGSLLFFKKHVFDSIGGFDTNIFLYYEETDVCIRMKKNGFSTYFIPSLKYIHLEGKSSTPNLNLKLEHWISYFYVTRKNFGLFKYLVLKWYHLFIYMLKSPFKAKNRFVFLGMLKMNESLALSLKHKQKIVD